jgi:chromosome segregation ATPase
MALRLTAFLVLAGGASAFSVDFSDSVWKSNPVAKVVNLLKDMQAQLQKEQDQDQEIYDAMACWCETNNKAKTKAISDGDMKSKDLAAAIEEYTAKSAQLKVDIEESDKEIKASTDAIAKATAIREKEASEFHEEEKNAISSITSLKGAVVTLGGHHEALSQEVLLSVQKVLKPHLGKGNDSWLRKLGVTPAQKQILASFVQKSFLQQSNVLQAAQPASGEIFGILKGMKESFETNLQSSQADEERAKGAYGQLKTAKNAELTAASKQYESKKADLADTDEKLADSKMDLKDTEKQLAADTAFLADLKDRCSNMDTTWAARQKVRSEEMKAISETLTILMDDDARDNFAKTQFLQMSSHHKSDALARKRASQLLLAVAKKANKPALSALALAMKSDVFTKIKAAIDNMVAQLGKESQDEIKHRDFCTEELNQNERQTTAKYEFKADLETRIEDLGMTISTLGEEISDAKAAVSTAQVELKKAAEIREKQNKEFQMTISDQRATQEILTKALERLQAFYSSAASLVQTTSKNAAHHGQAPPPGFDGAYKKNSGSGGAMGMLQNIIADSKMVEADATHDEQAAQTAYESFVKDSNTEIESLSKEIADKTSLKAQADGDKVAAEADHKATMGDLEDLSNLAGNLHRSCDYLLKNFEVRQSSRAQEIDALNQAKAIMSGADI